VSGQADWHGIWGFPLTPFAARGVDLELLAAGVAHQLDGGIDVLCACGVIAQLETLDRSEHTDSVRTIVEVAGGRVPVVATLIAGRDAPSLAVAAVEAGAQGVVVIPASPRPDATARCLRAIASALPGVPLILYHRPPLNLEIEALRRLAEIPELSWIKDGHRDVRQFRRLRGAEPRLQWVSAWEDVALAFWALGCDTFAPASTAYAPEFSAAWLQRLRGGDLEGARALLELHAYPLVDLRLARSGIDVAVIKAAMAPVRTRPPARPINGAERARVVELLAEMREALALAPVGA
jgi:dihydrodipicolinate synthase/N-acetylneuraminate lyase